MAHAGDLVDAARDLVDAILRLASDLLAAGADAERIHRRYVAASFELAEEVEARALLAASGDEAAISRLVAVVQQLRDLWEEARAELRDQAAGGRDT